MKERAKQLVEAHWGYVESLLNMHGTPEGDMEIIGFHYRTAMEHGFGHGVEWEQNRAARETWAQEVERKMCEPLADTPSPPLCNSCQQHPGECHGDYPATRDGGCEGYIKAESGVHVSEWYAKETAKAERKASLCHSCTVEKCTLARTLLCEVTDHCDRYASALRERMLDAKEEAPTAAEQTASHTAPSTNCADCIYPFCSNAGKKDTIDHCGEFRSKDEAPKPAPVALAICPSCSEHPGCKGTVDPARDGRCNGFSPKSATLKTLDLVQHINRQRTFSLNTFGPGARTKGVIDHITKELKEIEADPTDLYEWVDMILLSLDGAWRAGHSPEAIAGAINAKQTKNEGRVWPDWRTADPDKAIEHDRSGEADA